ncbi:SGNH/GDSL hydrolase family protein [Streptomyces sp. UH6]|uniref:SGNH/GDSL hydrolase family protein n=1 Tax=Streptomyces sp. UH6 TaxID=2748379 RepID=UPI0015D4DA13|nr:SGNH/GDSL hydrolase family protein [Streptomyces sp. UH6]NYV76431.1 SGNH/GDSL hydrolase family protein [Streptomyces sp. UH6]
MRRFRTSAVVSSFLLSVGLAFTGASAAQASAQAAGAYVALGDSYSSGVGAGSYTAESGSCKRSTNAYPQLWANANSPSSFSFVACGGATTSSVRSSQMGPLDANTALVSVTAGGNDAGFADVMTTCVISSNSVCLDRINSARSFITSTLPGNLDSLYADIENRAPNARVVVLGYPKFYDVAAVCVGLSDTKRSAINAAADHLNSVIAGRASAHGFAFGDVRPTFAGHEICSGSSWLHSVNWTNIGESYHPKAAGQSGGYLPVLNAND